MTRQYTNPPCNPTRRKVLAGIAATTAGAGVATAAIAANAAVDIGPNDRRLLELERQYAAADQAYMGATEAAAKIYFALPAKLRRLPDKQIFEWRVYMPSLPNSEVGMTARDLNDKAHWEAKCERYRAGLEAAYDKRCDEFIAARKPTYDACGLTAAQAEEDRLCTIADKLFEAIKTTPADGVHGMAVKFRLMDDGAHYPGVIEALQRDVARLVGVAS